MKNRKKDPNMPDGKMTKVKDFLPSPEELILPEKTIKVTILLSESSINSFKKLAKKHHTQYQKLIRNLLDKYTEKHLTHS